MLTVNPYKIIYQYQLPVVLQYIKLDCKITMKYHLQDLGRTHL